MMLLAGTQKPNCNLKHYHSMQIKCNEESFNTDFHFPVRNDKY